MFGKNTLRKIRWESKTESKSSSLHIARYVPVMADLNLENRSKLLLVLDSSWFPEQDSRSSEYCVFQLFLADSETAPVDSFL